MADTVLELRQKAAGKKKLEAKLEELHNQKREYDRKAVSLRVIWRKEQADVEKLEGREGRLFKNYALLYSRISGKELQ